MLKNFRTYQLAVSFHKACIAQKGIPPYLKDQLFRASASISLNLAEGSAKPTAKDQVKFYFIAMGSLRESQTAIEFITPEAVELKALGDQLGGHLARLIVVTKRRGQH